MLVTIPPSATQKFTLKDIRHTGIPINQMRFGSVSLPRFNATYIYKRICKITRAVLDFREKKEEIKTERQNELIS